MIERVKTIMAINSNDKDVIIAEIISNFTDAVNLYCGTTTLPKQFEFIVVEATVARMNRLGSEGLKSENIDVIGLSYIEDILEPYHTYLDSYKSSSKKVKFL